MLCPESRASPKIIVHLVRDSNWWPAYAVSGHRRRIISGILEPPTGQVEHS